MSDSADPYCPRCSLLLKAENAEFGTFWRCGSCGGRAVSLAVLRVLFTPDSVNPLWLNAIEGAGQPGCSCPSCRNAMIEVPLSGASDIRVDVCRICQFVWFDIRENDGLTPQAVIKPPQAISEHAMEWAEKDLQKAEALERAQRWRAIAIATSFDPFF